MDHPFDKQETRSTLIVTIRTVLYNELPNSYTSESIDNYYRNAIYDFVYRQYGGAA